jgi:hypothetical protein
VRIKIDSKAFTKDMKNIIGYSLGFLEGAEQGKTAFLNSLGERTVELLNSYIDSSARVNPSALHHVYEWNQIGSPAARLYDLEYTVSNLGLSVKSTFRQSSSIKNGSSVPFYNKARIMENGIPVTIKPRMSNVLAFESDGEQVFTKKPVTVSNPGGDNVEGSFENIFDEFFSKYFTQAFLMSSGMIKYLNSPTLYKKNLSRAKSGGKALGVATGYRWIANAGVNA